MINSIKFFTSTIQLNTFFWKYVYQLNIEKQKATTWDFICLVREENCYSHVNMLTTMLQTPKSRMKMAASSLLRLQLFPFLKKLPYTVTPATRWERFRCFSCSPAPPPSPPQSWQPFCKKKVVMRVAYVGTNYRGPFLFNHFHPMLFSSNTHSSYRYICSSFSFLVVCWIFIQVSNCNVMKIHSPVCFFFSLFFVFTTLLELVGIPLLLYIYGIKKGKKWFAEWFWV